MTRKRIFPTAAAATALVGLLLPAVVSSRMPGVSPLSRQIGAASSTRQVAGAPESLEVAPSRDAVLYGQGASLPLVWTVSLVPSRVDTLVESREGTYETTGGRILGRVSERLSTQGSGRVSFRETVAIPAGVIRSAASGGGRTLIYRRSFLSAGEAIEGEVALAIDGSIGRIEVSPAAIRVPLGSDVSTPVTWKATAVPAASRSRARATLVPPAGGIDIHSTEGVFMTPSGKVLGTNPELLALRLTATPATVGEQLAVPRRVFEQLADTKETALLYRRRFTEGFAEVEGVLRISLASRIGIGFSPDRVELRFLDGSILKTVAAGEPVQIVADVTFTGSGRLSAVWETAAPPSTSGSPFWVRRGFVNEFLAGGGHRKKIVSPPLETGPTGVYIVRFRITGTDVDEGDTARISYVVSAGATGERTGIRLLSPPESSAALPGTAFAWGPVGGTAAYQVELYEDPPARGAAPATGLLVGGGTEQAPLSHLVFSHLLPGRSYLWRVVAFGPDGAVLGESPLRRLVAP